MKKSLLLSLVALASSPIFAEEAAKASVSTETSTMWALSAGLCMGIAALGGAFGQSKVGAAAMEGIARNPKAKDDMFVPMILGLVFIETLVLFSFAIAFLMQGKFA